MLKTDHKLKIELIRYTNTDLPNHHNQYDIRNNTLTFNSYFAYVSLQETFFTDNCFSSVYINCIVRY